MKFCMEHTNAIGKGVVCHKNQQFLILLRVHYYQSHTNSKRRNRMVGLKNTLAFCELFTKRAELIQAPGGGGLVLAQLK